MIIPDEPGLAAAYADEQPILDGYWHPEAGDIVMDIGAAVGLYTLPALDAGAHVIAVDPDTVTTAKLERTAAANGLGDYQVIHCALFTSGGYPPEMRAALESSEHYYLIPGADVSWKTLDGLAQELFLTRLSLIKIDVEGAELGVLRSGEMTLTAFHPRLLIEDHTRVYPFVDQMNSRQQIVDFLDGLGYTTQLIPYDEPETARDYLVAE